MMKFFFLLLAITSSINCIGQKLTYKGDIVDTIKIISNVSGYHLDSAGTTTGVNDEYIIIFNPNKNKYTLSNYKRTNYKYTFEPHESLIKEKTIAKDRDISQIQLLNLLREFEKEYVRPTFEDLEITQSEFIKLTSKKNIIKVAKWHQTDWKFTKKYSTKEQNNLIYKGCQNIDSFNKFLTVAFDTTHYVMITDYSNLFEVHIITDNKKFVFEGKYPNPFKQPWYNQTYDDFFNHSSILNFGINKSLVIILPKDFSLIETIKIEALIDEYIEWYLKQRGIIF